MSIELGNDKAAALDGVGAIRQAIRRREPAAAAMAP